MATNLKKITQEELDSVISLHQVWLNGDGGGQADLSCYDLTGMDLSECNLTSANFRGSNLTSADLRGTTLTKANLVGTTISYVWLYDADLWD